MTERLMFAEEIAEAINVDPKTIKFYTQDGKREREAGTASLGTFPEPFDHVLRKIWNGHHFVRVNSPRWRASEVITWLENRKSNARWPNLEQQSKEAAEKLRAAS